MKHNYFRRFFSICFILLGITTTAIAQEVITYDFHHEGQNGIQLTSHTDGNAAIAFTIDQMTLSSFTYEGEVMQSIGINGISLPNEKGLPNVPTFSRYIAIPQDAEVVLHVVNYEQQLIENVNIEPSLGIQPEDAEPDMNYTKDTKIYSQNAFYPTEFATIGSQTSLRGVDVVSLNISPVKFNPVTKEAIVYHNIVVEIEFIGGKGHFGNDRLRSQYWDPILAQNILNYNSLPVIDYESRMQQWLRDGAEGAEYIIVIPNNEDFEEPAQRLKEYRMQQGIMTEVLRLDEMPATTTAQMKTYFHNAYNNWEVAPVAFMLFADHNTNMSQGIPAISTSHPYSGTCITDNQYADVTGDGLPEMVFSRLIAADGTEAAMMADKQIEYEFTNPNMDANAYNAPVTALGWQTVRWFQLCSEVVGGYFRAHGKNPNRINCIYEGTPGSSWSSAQNTSTVVNYFGPSGTGYIPQTPSELGGWTGGTPEQINVAINEGTMLVQHRDHGLETGWGEPAYRSNHVQQLTNVGKMPFVMSINCLTGKFDNSTPCFAETFMRHTYNGQNAGAVGMLCPTEVSYSFVNDVFVWGVYDQFQPDFLPDYGPYAAQEGNWQPAFGNVAGKYFLAQSSWPYNTSDKAITYTMFTAHCDAFLRLYSEVPQTMTVDHQEVQLAGLNTIQITAPEGTKIALTKGEGEDLEIIAVAEATGSVQNIEMEAQVPPTIIHLTVTGQNYLRYQADIEVVPAEGPYLIVNGYELSNEASQLNFSDEAGFDIVLKNVGVDEAPAGTATLSSESEYVTITDATVDFAAIAADATLSLDEAFGFTVADNVPNNTSILFNVTIASGDDEYLSKINVKAYAPEFKVGNVSITEIDGNGNGRLDPGETATLTFPIENNGDAVSHEVNATIVLNNAFMQLVSEPIVTVENIENDGVANVEYTIYVGNAPSGFAAEYTLNVESGAYTATRDFTSKIGLNVEDFEQGELDPTLWSNSTTAPWTFCTEQPYEGNYCLKSGSIGNSASTEITLTYEVSETDSIAFYYKVSSEANYDKMYFYIDNSQKDVWSGTVAWTRAQYVVTAGTHTFKWKYQKDGSQTSGSDCCWIDFVLLPMDRSLAVAAGLDVETCPTEPVQLDGYAANYESLEWTTSGDGTFDDATIMNPVYTPGTQDITNGEVTLTISATSEGTTMTDDMVITFLPDSEISEFTVPETACFNEEINVSANVNVYESIEWTTSGDGTFEDSTALETIYILGENDIINGNAELTFKVFGCNMVTHSQVVTITGHAEVETEENVNACGMNPFELAATANNYETVMWTTAGDGTFEDATILNAVYTPGEQDLANGNVVLTIVATGCDTAEAQVNVTINALPTVEVVTIEQTLCENVETTEVELMLTGAAPYLIEIEGDSNIYTVEENGILTINVNPEATEYKIVSVTDNNNCTSEVEATFKINIIELPVPAQPSGEILVAKDQTATSEYTVAADEAFTSYEWQLTPENAGTVVATDNKAVITWNTAYNGNVEIRVIGINDICFSEPSEALVVTSSMTGVDEINASEMSIFPNPTSDKLHITIDGINAKANVTIYNTIGEMVYNQDVTADNGLNINLDLSTLANGTYFVTVRDNENVWIKKIVKR